MFTMAQTHSEYSEVELSDPRVADAIRRTIFKHQKMLHELQERNAVHLFDGAELYLARRITFLKEQIVSLQKQLQQL